MTALSNLISKTCCLNNKCTLTLVKRRQVCQIYMYNGLLRGKALYDLIFNGLELHSNGFISGLCMANMKSWISCLIQILLQLGQVKDYKGRLVNKKQYPVVSHLHPSQEHQPFKEGFCNCIFYLSTPNNR